MSTATLHQIDANDTPSAMDVPKPLSALKVWAVGRFGGGFLLAVACSWTLMHVCDGQRGHAESMTTLREARFVPAQTVGSTPRYSASRRA